MSTPTYEDYNANPGLDWEGLHFLLNSYELFGPGKVSIIEKF